MASNPRSNATYQRERRRFLASHAPVCHWCGRQVSDALPASDPRKATIDHLIEVDAAPELVNDPSWWVVACMKCNSSRGIKYRNARDGRGISDEKPSRDW